MLNDIKGRPLFPSNFWFLSPSPRQFFEVLPPSSLRQTPLFSPLKAAQKGPARFFYSAYLSIARLARKDLKDGLEGLYEAFANAV